MKKGIFITFLLVLSLVFCINANVSASSLELPIDWEKSFGGEQHDYMFVVQETNDGNYIAVGRANTIWSYDSNILFVKLGSDGSILSEKIIDIPDLSYEYGTFIDQTMDGGYIISGSNPTNGVLVKLNSNCDIEWYQIYPDVEYLCVQSTSDNGYIVGGLDVGGIYESTPIVAKINESGAIEWSKTIKDTFLLIKGIFAEDGGYVIGAKDANYNGYIAKIGANGECVWEKVIDKSLGLQVECLENPGDGGWVLAGTAGRSIFILKITPELTANGWVFHEDFCEYFQRCQLSQHNYGWADATSDGGYIIAGEDHYNNGFHNTCQKRIYLVKTDSSGNQLWDASIGSGINSIGSRCIQETSDGGFIVAGDKIEFIEKVDEDRFTHSDAYILKLQNIE